MQSYLIPLHAASLSMLSLDHKDPRIPQQRYAGGYCGTHRDKKGQEDIEDGNQVKSPASASKKKKKAQPLESLRQSGQQ